MHDIYGVFGGFEMGRSPPFQAPAASGRLWHTRSGINPPPGTSQGSKRGGDEPLFPDLAFPEGVARELRAPIPWEAWKGSIVPAVRGCVVDYGAKRALWAILALNGRGRVELVLRIEEDGELWSVMADWRRERVKDLAAAQVWAEAVICEWLMVHGHEGRAAALMSPEEAAFWSSQLRVIRDRTAKTMEAESNNGEADWSRAAGPVRPPGSGLSIFTYFRINPPQASTNLDPNGAQSRGGFSGQGGILSDSTMHDIYCSMLLITH